jgi:hypothetical protein
MSIRFPYQSEVETCPDAPGPFSEDITELSLLLPASQAAALERTAKARGLTTGEMLRGLIRDFLIHNPGTGVRPLSLGCWPPAGGDL